MTIYKFLVRFNNFDPRAAGLLSAAQALGFHNLQRLQRQTLSLRKYCADHGLFLYTHWHTILIIPPLIITEEQLKEGMDVIDKALEITDKAVK